MDTLTRIPARNVIDYRACIRCRSKSVAIHRRYVESQPPSETGLKIFQRTSTTAGYRFLVYCAGCGNETESYLTAISALEVWNALNAPYNREEE